MQRTWIQWLFFICFFFLPILSEADDFSDKTCPVYVQIAPVIELNDAQGKDIDWVVQALADTIPLRLKPTNIRVVTPDLIRSTMKKLADKQAAGGGDDNQLKSLGRGDFIVLVKWQKVLDIKHILTLRLQTRSADVIGIRSMDVTDLKSQANQIDSFARAAGRDFGTLLTNRFYCIKLTPKEVDVSPGNKQQFTAEVENLKGDPISGETVNFDILDSNVGMISPGSGQLSSGKTQTTYEQKKSGDNLLKAAITPHTDLSEESQTVAKIQSDKMTLQFKTEETAEYHEAGGSIKASITRDAEIPLTIDRKTKQVTGHGVANKTPWINSMFGAAYGGTVRGHSAPEKVHEDVTVTGSLINDDKTLQLTVTTQPIEQFAPAAATAQVDGATFTYRGPANMGDSEKIAVTISNQLGAIKEIPIQQTYGNGVVLHGEHLFKLTAYQAPAQ